MTADFSKVRQDFPLLTRTMQGKPLIYLDSAATAQKPQCVIDAMTDFMQAHYGTVNRAVYQLASEATNRYQTARRKVKEFLHAAKEEEIIFTRGCTDSINLVAASFGKAFLKPGDEVLISDLEHHANIVPWQMACEERQAHLKVIPSTPEGEITVAALEKCLSPKTKIVALCHISNSIGTVLPIADLIAAAHRQGAYVLVDGAQSAPHLAIDVQLLDADFFTFSGHKLFGPTGIGILYGKQALLEAMPPYQGGGDMIETVFFEKTTYNQLPLKFEAGTPMTTEAIGLAAAIDYLSQIGMKAIADHEEQLLDHLLKTLQGIPHLQLIGQPKKRAAAISFIIEGVHPLDLATMLDLKGVAIRTGHHCCQPVMRKFNVPATCRASIAFYNTHDEISLFGEYLQKTLKLFL